MKLGLGVDVDSDLHCVVALGPLVALSAGLPLGYLRGSLKE